MAERTKLNLTIQLGDEIEALPIPRPQLRRWVDAAIEHPTRLTLRFVGTTEGRELNRAYRGRDYPTNVLTFTYEEDAPPDSVQADVVLCVPVVEREAREQRKSLRRHLAHLVVHGVLHATGYDHEDAESAELMETHEARVLARFGIPDPYADPEGDGQFEN